jgi:hypothetical protein
MLFNIQVQPVTFLSHIDLYIDDMFIENLLGVKIYVKLLKDNFLWLTDTNLLKQNLMIC